MKRFVGGNIIKEMFFFLFLCGGVERKRERERELDYKDYFIYEEIDRGRRNMKVIESCYVNWIAVYLQ